MCYKNKNIKKDLKILSKTYNFKVNFFENSNTILIENNLERWFIKISKSHLTLFHGNKNHLLDGKICSYHLQREKELKRETLFEFFKFINDHGRNKILKKTRLEKLFEQIS